MLTTKYTRINENVFHVGEKILKESSCYFTSLYRFAEAYLKKKFNCLLVANWGDTERGLLLLLHNISPNQIHRNQNSPKLK